MDELNLLITKLMDRYEALTVEEKIALINLYKIRYETKQALRGSKVYYGVVQNPRPTIWKSKNIQT